MELAQNFPKVHIYYFNTLMNIKSISYPFRPYIPISIYKQFIENNAACLNVIFIFI